jgi:hypothetical protein
MGTTTKQLRRVDGGISRRGEPALSEAAALGRAATPWRAVDAVNMESVNDLLATRNGCGPSYADTENLGVVLWISGWAPWDHGNGSWDDDWRYIIENGTVKRGTGDGTFPTRRPRWDAASFRILVPANEILNVLPTAALNIQWTQYKTGRGGYKIEIKDFDTGAQVYVKADWPIEGFDLPANTLALSKKYTIKVWAITSRNAKGKPTGWVSATNTRVFTTRLSTPTNLAPVGEIATLTPTFTCDAVAKAVRYKVKIYDATGTTLLHTSMALLLPSYPLGAGVLTDYATKKWTFTAYPDTACTAAYGVESAQVSIYKIELDDTLADGTVGTAYTGTVAATGGTGPYTYAVTSGTLPAGLSLSSGGAVTGTPTTAATSAFTVTATDANGDTGSRAYSVTVAEAKNICTEVGLDPLLALKLTWSGTLTRCTNCWNVDSNNHWQCSAAPTSLPNFASSISCGGESAALPSEIRLDIYEDFCGGVFTLYYSSTDATILWKCTDGLFELLIVSSSHFFPLFYASGYNVKDGDVLANQLSCLSVVRDPCTGSNLTFPAFVTGGSYKVEIVL